MDSKRLEMSLSESDKLETSVLGCRFSEKTEHLPIKKRRFLFRTSSPPLGTGSSEGTEQVASCPHSSSQEVQPQPDASCPLAASSTIDDLILSGSIDDKADEENFVETSKKASDSEDIYCKSLASLAAGNNGLGGDADHSEGSRIVSYGIKNIEAICTVKIEPDVKLANMSAKETDFHISTAPSKDVASTMHCFSLDKATVGESCAHLPSEFECGGMNQVTSKTQNFTALDDRLNWDLNTVMDAWEEPLECSTSTCAERNNNCKEGNIEDYKQGRGCESASENAGGENLPDLKSLAHTIDEPEQEENKPSCNGINKLSSIIYSAPHVAVNKIQSLQNQHVDGSTGAAHIAVPRIVKLEHPSYDNSAKHLNVNCKSTNDLSCPVAAGTESSLDYSITPGFDPCMSMCHLKENFVPSTTGCSGNDGKHSITAVQKTDDKLNLSLVTAASRENGAHQSGNTFDEDDKAQVKRAITSNGIIMENLIGKGTERSEDAYKGDHKTVNQTLFGSIIGIQSLVLAKGDDQPAAVPSIPKVVCSDTVVVIKTERSPVTETSGEPLMQLNGSINQPSDESHTGIPNDHAVYDKDVCEEPLNNGFGYENPPSEIQAGSEVDNVDDLSVGYDSQFEDGEVRESSIQSMEGSEGEDREDKHGKGNRGTSLHQVNVDAQENGSQCEPKCSSRIQSSDIGSQRAEAEVSSVLLPEKLDSSDQVSGSEPNETANSTREVTMKDASKSDQWKMNVSGLENQSSVNNVSNIRDLSSIKFSRIERYGSETEELEKKAGSRFYGREPVSHIGEPSTRDSYIDRGGFQIRGCSSRNAEDSAFRSSTESGVQRSLRWAKYSSHIPASGTLNHSPGRDSDVNHLHSPPYPGPSFHRPLLEDVASVDNLTNKAGVNPKDDGRPDASSYATHRSFRNRLLANREEDAFRARLGLRPSGDTCNNRFVNVGGGKSLRYGSRHNGGGPRGRYYGLPSDDYNEPPMELSHFPSRRPCFSPTERRENHPCARHHSGSTSPISRTRSPIIDGFRHRSRSPNLRSDTRMRRPRSPNFRHGFEADHEAGYNLEPRNNHSPPGTRWVKYKQRSTVFDRRSPPHGKLDPPIGERLTFYDPSRKTKQNENYRSGHPGRLSELHETGRGAPRYFGSNGGQPDHGYTRGGFVRRYDMGSRPVKHVEYDEEDDYGPVYDSHDKESMEFHGRGNPKPYRNGINSRFHDLPRRPREERENW